MVWLCLSRYRLTVHPPDACASVYRPEMVCILQSGNPRLMGTILQTRAPLRLPASEMGKVFVCLHHCLKSRKRGEGGKKALALPSAARSDRADSILSVSFIQCYRFICGNPEGTVVVAQSACASNKDVPVAGSVGKGSSSLKTPSIPTAAFPSPVHPWGLRPRGQQGNPLPGCGFPSSAAGCQLRFEYKCCHIVLFFFLFALS